MTRRRRLAAYLVLLLGLLAALAVTAPAAHAEPSLSVGEVRTEPGLVEFQLTARDLAAGQAIDPAGITLEVDGAPLPLRETLEVATFTTEADDERRVVALVIDVSNSMTGQPMADAIAAASAYADELPSDIEVGIVTVSTQAQVMLAPTGDREQVQQTLTDLLPGGSTALYDALVAAASLVDDPTYTERRVLVLSDGADTASFTTLPDAMQRLLAAGAAVDTVAFQTVQTVSDLLAGVSADTGGKAYLAQDAADLGGAFASAATAFGVRLQIAADVPAELSGAETILEVTVPVGDQMVRTPVPVTFAVDPDATLALVTVPSASMPGYAQWAVVALVFLALLAVGLLTFSPLLDISRRRRRLAQVEQFAVAQPGRPSPAEAEPGSPVARAALALSERVVQSRGMESRIALQLDRAGLRLRPHEWLLLQGLVSVTVAILLSLFIPPWAALVVGLAGGWAATELYHRRRAEKRVQAFATLLPDALQLVIGSLRSGFSLSQAIDAMVRELPDPISSEFGRALGEARLGESLEDALDRVARRMRSEDLAWSVVAIRVQQQVGGNLAEVLTTTVKTIRERDALRRHVRALSAEGRLSAWILVALPVVAGLFMFTVRTEYVLVLLTDPIGLLMLSVAVLLLVAGAFWMARVVKVEV